MANKEVINRYQVGAESKFYWFKMNLYEHGKLQKFKEISLGHKQEIVIF